MRWQERGEVAERPKATAC